MVTIPERLVTSYLDIQFQVEFCLSLLGASVSHEQGRRSRTPTRSLFKPILSNINTQASLPVSMLYHVMSHC